MRKLLQIKVAVLICRLYSPLPFTRKAAFVECVPPHTPVHRLLYTHSTFLFSFKFKFTQVLLKNELACAAVFSLAPIVKGHLFKKKNSPLAVSWARLRPGRYLRWGDLSLRSWFGSELSVAWRRSGLQSLQRCLQPHTHTHVSTHIWYDVHNRNVVLKWGKSWPSALHLQFSLQHGSFTY